MMRFKNIDFFRFIFALLIVMFHGRGIIELPIWLRGIKHCNVCVDFFFIISGFLLFLKFKPNTDTFEFAKKRFLRLAPNIWLSVLLLGILSIFIKGIHWDLDGNILRILFLDNVGFSPITGGTSVAISWFVYVLFWTSIFYVYISNIFYKKYLNLIIWLLVMFCYAIYVQHNNFGIGHHAENVYLIFNIGICRALASIGLGYFISMAYKEGILQNVKTKGSLLISLCECFLIGFLTYYLVFSGKLPGKTGMCYIVPFAILLYFMLIKKGVISKLLDNDLSVRLGKYSYSIYCFHEVVLPIFKYHIFKHNPILLIEYPLYSYVIQTVCAVILGILLYYIFERPVSNYFNKKLINKSKFGV